jgi:predicted nuclease of predicted toxin-antitoxin system
MSKNLPKILVDEMDDGMDEKLKEIGFDAYSVKKLRMEGLKLHTDFSIINYAKKNKMILITRDTESGEACDENNIPCILLDTDEIFKIVLEKLRQF